MRACSPPCVQSSGHVCDRLLWPGQRHGARTAWASLAGLAGRRGRLGMAVLHGRRSETLSAHGPRPAWLPARWLLVPALFWSADPIAPRFPHRHHTHHFHHRRPSPSTPAALALLREHITLLLPVDRRRRPRHRTTPAPPPAPLASRRPSHDACVWHSTAPLRRPYTHPRPSLSHCLRAHTTLPPILHPSAARRHHREPARRNTSPAGTAVATRAARAPPTTAPPHHAPRTTAHPTHSHTNTAPPHQ